MSNVLKRDDMIASIVSDCLVVPDKGTGDMVYKAVLDITDPAEGRRLCFAHVHDKKGAAQEDIAGIHYRKMMKRRLCVKLPSGTLRAR